MRFWRKTADFGIPNGFLVRNMTPRSISKTSKTGFKRVYLKARSGPGRNRATWVEALNVDLREEFDRL